MLLVDLRPKGVKGNATETALGRAHITCNKNGIPFDPEKPTVTSGVRLGSPAGTTRGFGEPEFRLIGDWIVEVVDGLAAHGEHAQALGRCRVGDIHKTDFAFEAVGIDQRHAVFAGGHDFCGGGRAVFTRGADLRAHRKRGRAVEELARIADRRKIDRAIVATTTRCQQPGQGHTHRQCNR